MFVTKAAKGQRVNREIFLSLRPSPAQEALSQETIDDFSLSQEIDS